MGNYSAALVYATASSTLLMGGIQAPGANMRRIKIYDWTVGSDAAPGDTALTWRALRTSTAGTSSAVTPSPLDLADAACVSVAGQAFTVNPTLGVVLMDIPLNQRASFRWVAAPGSELVVPAVANAGIGFQTPVSTAIQVRATALFQE